MPFIYFIINIPSLVSETPTKPQCSRLISGFIMFYYEVEELQLLRTTIGRKLWKSSIARVGVLSCSTQLIALSWSGRCQINSTGNVNNYSVVGRTPREQTIDKVPNSLAWTSQLSCNDTRHLLEYAYQKRHWHLMHARYTDNALADAHLVTCDSRPGHNNHIIHKYDVICC